MKFFAKSSKNGRKANIDLCRVKDNGIEIVNLNHKTNQKSYELLKNKEFVRH